MKRFHVSVSVADLVQSINFYQTLFGSEPTVRKDDYAKWMLEEIQQRLHAAGESTLEQADAECCYAQSSKTWVRDPDHVAWETFVTHNDITHFGADRVPDQSDAGGKQSRCCA